MKPLPKGLLVDTWWYALTGRWTEKQFLKLAKLRRLQGFNAIQLVVGVPPEVGPLHPSAASIVGPAWWLYPHFRINHSYLQLARNRIQKLNRLGFTVIVYGAWGHQLSWLGNKNIQLWWKEIVHYLDGLKIIYCLTGESNLWIGMENMLMPNKSTSDLANKTGIQKFVPSKLIHYFHRIRKILILNICPSKRKYNWSKNLSYLHGITFKPILIHTLPGEISYRVVNNSHLLRAITVQTGHDYHTRNNLWKLPLQVKISFSGSTFLNLESWYEGTHSKFGVKDQLYAYWSSQMASADGFCYGAQGIWNLGDGNFLSHWGTQTLKEAIKLHTPYLLGKSHMFFSQFRLQKTRIELIQTKKGLVKITRTSQKHRLSYFPEVKKTLIKLAPGMQIWDPMKGKLVSSPPKNGQLITVEKL